MFQEFLVITFLCSIVVAISALFIYGVYWAIRGTIYLVALPKVISEEKKLLK
jgi:hypothetical protein